MTDPMHPSPLDRIMRFCLQNKLLVSMLTVLLFSWGVLVAPFDWQISWLPRDPVPVDAIPDTGENQQIVFTKWPGRSPQDVEDQVSYPLTVALLGTPGVKTIRSNSMFGFSSVFVIFDEDVEFYWSRSRILEKLASLPADTLPGGVQPTLGPDATALGQVFWYTLEGRDEQGEARGGWDLQELRSIQDWQVRYALASVEGVAEVASIGGYVKEYQIDVDPDALRAHGVTLDEVFQAVRNSNVDVGARTIEVNSVEYVIRGLGFVKHLQDLEQAVIKVTNHVPLTIKQVATVALGPAMRRGALDKGGAEAVGGVVVVRYGANPLAVIQGVKDKIQEISEGLPSKTLADGTVSQVQVVPFYDRSGLIHETLGTLKAALSQELLVTMIVVLVLVAHLQSALLISCLLPMAVLMCFIGMKHFGVDANVVALSGIAIAIGTMVDMGIVLCENILKHLPKGGSWQQRMEAVYRGASEVGAAVLTAVLTTVVSFLPVFTMTGAEGKLFQPLAFTKTFALLASIFVALVIIPPFAHLLFRGRPKVRGGMFYVGLLVALILAITLAGEWQPLGPNRSLVNGVFVLGLLGGLLLCFYLFQLCYERILRWCLAHKLLFLSIPGLLVFLGLLGWLGFQSLFGWAPQSLQTSKAWSYATQQFPGLGKEFMPSLDEGSFLLMPVTMPHASIGAALDVIQKQDMLIRGVPEVESVVGKIGRVESPLDPAPISMVETVINYKSEYMTDDQGRTIRQWRDHIHSPEDIFREVEQAAALPGVTRASMLQPIETRRIMLQTGMRAPMGVKVYGPDLPTVESVGLQIEELLKQVPSVRAETVLADRIEGKPYLEIDINRQAIARYGLTIQEVQDVIQVAIGGRRITTTVEGRERYPVRVRYQRELRDQIESLQSIIVPSKDGAQIPMGQLAELRYVPGPQSIKSEDATLVGYVIFDKQAGLAEVEVVETCQEYLQQQLDTGAWKLPAGVSYRFTGSYENQLHSERTLRLVLPLALFMIFMILYLLFRSVLTTFMVFTGVFVAWSGGFIMLWLYGQGWFLDFSVFGVDMRDLFQVSPLNLSVAVWVGFLALFGIATDDGVILATYLKQSFKKQVPTSVTEVREAVVLAGKRRIRPCLMTSATTILALIPVLTSTGRGSDVMVPMAIPSFGGMAMVLITVFVVPTLYCMVEERKLRKAG